MLNVDCDHANSLHPQKRYRYERGRDRLSFLLFVAIAAMPTFSRDVRFGVGRFLNNLKDYPVLPPSIVSGVWIGEIK